MAKKTLAEVLIELQISDAKFRQQLNRSFSSVAKSSSSAFKVVSGSSAGAFAAMAKQAGSFSKSSANAFRVVSASSAGVFRTITRSSAGVFKSLASSFGNVSIASSRAAGVTINSFARSSAAAAKLKQQLIAMQQKSDMRNRLRDSSISSRMAGRGGGLSGVGGFGATFAGFTASNVVLRAVSGITNGMRSIVSLGYESNAQLEQMTASFEVMLGSAAAAKSLVLELRDYAARTPLRVIDLSSASVALLSTQKIARDQLLPTIEKLTDAAAGSAQGFESFPRIIRAVSQMLSKGKVTAQDMLQLAEAGIPAWGALATVMGKSQREVQDMSQKGQLGMSAVMKLVDGLGKRYEGLAAKQSKTWSGLVSTLKDQVEIEIQKVSKSIFDLSKIQLEGLVKWFDSDKAAAFFKTISDGVSRVAGWIKAGIESPLVRTIAKFALLAGGVAIAGMAFSALVAGAAFLVPLVPLAVKFAVVISLVTAAAMTLGKAFRSALDSKFGRQILADLSAVKFLVTEIAGQLVSKVASAIEFISEKWNNLFAGDAGDKIGGFIATLTGGLQNVLDVVSVLTNDFGKTWEILKVGAAAAMSYVSDRVKHLFSTEIPAFVFGLGDAYVALLPGLRGLFTELFVYAFERGQHLFTQELPALFTGFVNGGIEGLKDLMSKWREMLTIVFDYAADKFSSLTDALKALASGDFGKAGEKFLQFQVGAEANAGEKLAGLGGSSAAKFTEEIAKSLAGVPEFKSSANLQKGADDLRNAVADAAAAMKGAMSGAPGFKPSGATLSLIDQASGLYGAAKDARNESRTAAMAEEMRGNIANWLGSIPSKLGEMFDMLAGPKGLPKEPESAEDEAKKKKGRAGSKADTSITGVEEVWRKTQEALLGDDVPKQQLTVQQKQLAKLEEIKSSLTGRVAAGAGGKVGSAVGGAAGAIAGGIPAVGNKIGRFVSGLMAGRTNLDPSGAVGAIGAGIKGAVGKVAGGFASVGGMLSNVGGVNLGMLPKAKSVAAEKITPEEKAFRAWMTKIGHTADKGYNVDKNFDGGDYDYRGYFKKNGPVALGEGEHLTDEFKLPNHPTFSVESKYATGDDKAKAGRWEGDTFIPPTSRRNGIGGISESDQAILQQRLTTKRMLAETDRLGKGMFRPMLGGGGSDVVGRNPIFNPESFQKPQNPEFENRKESLRKAFTQSKAMKRAAFLQSRGLAIPPSVLKDLPVGRGGPGGAIGGGEDKTDQQKVVDSLKESNTHLSSIAKQAGNWVVSFGKG